MIIFKGSAQDKVGGYKFVQRYYHKQKCVNTQAAQQKRVQREEQIEVQSKRKKKQKKIREKK